MILDQFKLDGKVAIVTGGSRGLGQGMAIGLAEAGADVALVATGDMSQTQKHVEAEGRKCIAIQADLTKKESVATIVEKVGKHFGGIDILVNNAGIIRRAPITESPYPVFPQPDSWQTNDSAETRGKNHQHCLDAKFPGRHPCALVHSFQKCRHGVNAYTGQRTGRLQY